MEFNKETFEKALKANKIVRYKQHFEDVVKSYLEIENQALRIHDVVGRSDLLVCSCGSRLVKTTGGYHCGNAKCSV